MLVDLLGEIAIQLLDGVDEFAGAALVGYTNRLADNRGPTSIVMDIPRGLRLVGLWALQTVDDLVFHSHRDAVSEVYISLNPLYYFSRPRHRTFLGAMSQRG